LAYIGNIPAESFASFETETFSVSATTNYTLSHAVTNENEIRLVINGVVQQPGSGKAYTASGTTLTLTSATVSGDVMYAVYLGRALQTVNPPNASVGSAQIADSLISGKTALSATPADTDELLISDAGTLKRVDYSYLKSANTPMFSAYIGGNQSIANNTATTVTYNSEVFDTGSDFNSSTYKWTVPETGKYLINVRMAFDSSADFFSSFQIVKDGVGDMFSIQMAHDNTSDTITGSLVLSLTASEVYYVQATQTSGGSLNLIGNHQNSEFSAFKLIT